MATIFQRCQPEIAEMAQELIDNKPYHKATKEAEVAIDYLWAFSEPGEDGEPTGPAITKDGYSAAGLCKIVNSHDRALGHGDVEIQLDGDNWKDLTYAEQQALLDHELYHIVVKMEGKDQKFVKRDSYGRPVIYIRKHDRQHGHFDIIAKEHGAASYEVKQAMEVLDEAGSIYFPNLPTLQSEA